MDFAQSKMEIKKRGSIKVALKQTNNTTFWKAMDVSNATPRVAVKAVLLRASIAIQLAWYK